MRRMVPSLPLWIACVVSLAAMVGAAQHGMKWGVGAAAFGFAIAAAASAHRLGTFHRARAAASGAQAPQALHALAAISRITTLVYAWGGVALLTLYRFTPVTWQHGWQYGSAMLLIAAGLAAYLYLLGQPDTALAAAPAVRRAADLAALQGLAIAGALLWLAASGKIASPKGDWAANAIFFSGGLAVAWISAVVVATHRRITGQTSV